MLIEFRRQIEAFAVTGIADVLKRHSNLMESFREHKAVLDALRRKDAEAAVRALQANIQ
ncbi:MAG: FCD domain-containing protein [Gemmataceae bacterium]|nr:FCD domain-containing protein [Gemmataceae bacterium]MDW8267285.1 FCD domain-containing protein [Gemmataceae bacterium]